MSTNLTNAQTTLQNNIDELPKSLLNALYPVGSLYISTTSTCPLQTLGIGTWTKQSATTLVTSINTNVPIKGTGKCLGLVGAHRSGANVENGLGSIDLNSDSDEILVLIDNSNIAVGAATSVYNTSNNNSCNAVGITTNAATSGIVGTVTRSTIAVTIWKRTA